MCPACFTSMALVLAGGTSAGGLTVVLTLRAQQRKVLKYLTPACEAA